MNTLAIQLIALAIQEAPSVIQYLNLAAMANDITDEQLALIRSSSHTDVQNLAQAIADAKAGK